MKKITAILLLVSMLLLCACAKKAEEPQQTLPKPEATEEPAEATDEPTGEPEVGTLAGGWTINADLPECEMEADAKADLDAALEGMTGVGYTPVAYLGSQVVAGMNRAYLCKSTTVTANPVTYLTVVTVYKDLEGKAEVTDIREVSIPELFEGEQNVEFNPETMAGGWTTAAATGSGLTEDVQASFDKATKELMGVNYKPLVCLGSQVVAGSNYAVLALASTVTEKPATALAVVKVYADLEGGAQVLTVNNFPITK